MNMNTVPRANAQPLKEPSYSFVPIVDVLDTVLVKIKSSKDKVKEIAITAIIIGIINMKYVLNHVLK